MTTEKRPRVALAIGQVWRTLPIRAKLLLPLMLGIVVALGVLFFQVQTPIDSLAQGSAKQALIGQVDVYQERIESYLSDRASKLLALTTQPAVNDFTSTVSNNPGTDAQLGASILSPLFFDQLRAANSPFYRLR